MRTIALAILFGGSLAVVFTAVSLVKAATAAGEPVSEAAARNAPIFIQYAIVNLIAGFVLLIGEGLDYAKRRLWNRSTIAQYTCSLLCVATTMIFALGLVPPMKELLPTIKTNEQARQEFHKLHETSRIVFGGTMLLALASLILPIFGALKVAGVTADRESA